MTENTARPQIYSKRLRSVVNIPSESPIGHQNLLFTVYWRELQTICSVVNNLVVLWEEIRLNIELTYRKKKDRLWLLCPTSRSIRIREERKRSAVPKEQPSPLYMYNRPSCNDSAAGIRCNDQLQLKLWEHLISYHRAICHWSNLKLKRNDKT